MQQIDARIRVIDGHQPVRFRERHLSQQDGIHDSEDRSVRADAERESQYSHECETRILEQHPGTVANIVQEVVHQLLPKAITHNAGRPWDQPWSRDAPVYNLPPKPPNTARRLRR